MDLVSIVIPTYKRPDRLALSLESILNQTYKNIEVVLVDDNGIGSEYDDATAKVAQKYSKLFNSFIYVKNKINLGGGGARNEGIKIAQGEYITFLDDDDTFAPNKIELQVKKFQESACKNLGFVYCQMTLFDDLTGNKIYKTNNFYSGNDIPFIENLKGCIAGTPTILALKSALLNVNGFNYFRSGQDWALITDLLTYGYEVDYLEESLVNVFVSSRERISNSTGKILSLEGELKNYKDSIAKQLNDEKLVRSMYYYHNLQLSNALKYSNKRKAVLYYIKMSKYGFNIAHTVKFGFGLIFGERLTVYIRSLAGKKS